MKDNGPGEGLEVSAGKPNLKKKGAPLFKHGNLPQQFTSVETNTSLNE